VHRRFLRALVHSIVTQPSNAFGGGPADVSATIVTEPAETTSADDVPTKRSMTPGSMT